MNALDISTEELVQSSLVGATPFLETDIGFEVVARAARLTLLTMLDDELDRQSDRWRAGDAAMQALGMDPGVPETVLEHVQPENLHEGPHESLLTAPVSSFPNITVSGYLSNPSGSQFDQFDTSEITMYIECMVLSGPIDRDHSRVYETIVHRKITRMTEAAARVIRQSGTLGGAVLPIDRPPVGGIAGASYVRYGDAGHGPEHLMQGSRLQYTMQRNHSL